MIEANKNKRAEALKPEKHLCKEFGFTDWKPRKALT